MTKLWTKKRIAFLYKNFEELCAKHSLEGWSLRLFGGKRVYGLCYVDEKRILISKHYLIHAKRYQLLHLLKHEVAHAIVGNAERSHHGPLWIAKCKELGIRPIVQYEVCVALFGWIADCSSCKSLVGVYNKRAEALWACPFCGNIENFVWRKNLK